MRQKVSRIKFEGIEKPTTEVTLYNQDGEAKAYYVSPSEEEVIYLWDGQPTAYIVVADQVVYGYNGKVIGWFEDGILYDTEGDRKSFLEYWQQISTSLQST